MSGPPPAESAWRLLLTASAMAEALEEHDRPRAFLLSASGELHETPPESLDPAAAALRWSADRGWTAQLNTADPRGELVNLYLPLCSATAAHPITVGHLGQSLDGFIATHSGDSQFVTGDDNIVHMHRLRALSDAVVVGAGTVAADNPRLTTRLVPGPNPLRVVFDPGRRLTADAHVFSDAAAPTMYVCGRHLVQPGETHIGTATIATIEEGHPVDEVSELLRLLRARGCARVFVEGGGVTVSTFLEANLLDRLQITVAPLFIGDGRPAIRLAPHASLRDCRRPGYRVFRMGGDVLFDCELTSRGAQPAAERPDAPVLAQII